jgi:2-keto-3-deoxy-L-rhamnonate aldolase RhmA
LRHARDPFPIARLRRIGTNLRCALGGKVTGMEGFMDRVRSAGRGLLGTWVKIASLETVELLGHAGFDFVVIDMEHAPLALDRVYELIFASQRMGMAALVRLPDQLGTPVQPLLDAGADGLLVPRVTSTEVAAAITARMVFAPAGERGLGFTSRAGRWSLMSLPEYLRRGDEQCLRMIQLEDWATLEAAARFAALKHVNGLFVGLGDLFLSSGRAASSPEVQALVGSVLKVTKEAGVLSGIAVGTPAEARQYLEMGYSLVMVSNDATLFGRAAAEMVRASRVEKAPG